MKIKNIKVWKKDLGLKKPYTIAYKTVNEVINVFVEIELENGIKGIGACNPSKKVVNENVEDVYQTLSNESFNFLIDKNIYCFESLLIQNATIYKNNPGCQCAIDIALHDAFCKQLKIRLVDYYGQKIQSLPTSVTIGIKNIDDTLQEAKEYFDLGFNVLKIKTGLNPEEDAERVIKVYEKFPNATIRVDANQGYNVSDLLRFVTHLKNFNVELIEQPFNIKDFITFFNQLSPEIQKIVVADESCKNPSDVLQLILNVSTNKIYNFKLMKTGGLYNAKLMAKMAQYQNIDLMWGCNDESMVSLVAALHLAYSFENTKYLDLDGNLDLICDVVTGGFSIQNGCLLLNDKIGLGIEKILLD